MKIAVGLFAKPPIPGTVKTRLTPPLTAEEAAALYRAFLIDTARICADDPDWTFLVFSPDPKAQAAAWPKEAPSPAGFLPQKGADLGERLHGAFQSMFARGHGPCLIVGSDHPTLPATRLRDALEKLRWADVVLGPSLDGGYYLIGLMDSPVSGLLDAVPWSTPRVLRATLDRTAQAGLRARLLLPWYDVDTPKDLDFLARGETPARPSATADALRSLPWKPL